LKFDQEKGKIGGAIDLLCKYRIPVRLNGRCSGISINLGIMAKTEGFLLEEVSLDDHIGFRIGTSIWLK
jgi:hypothetical protein